MLRTKLSVNLNKVALLRNSREGNWPDPVFALVSEYPDREYNIEGNPFHNLMGHLEAVRPDQATFVPDSLGQKTSDHGFDLSDPAVCDAVRPLIAQAKAWGCRVSLFMDPAPALMAKAAELGADRVELYTEGWAQAHGTEAQDKVLEQYAASVKAAREAGLDVNAGHDLSLDNLEVFLKACRPCAHRRGAPVRLCRNGQALRGDPRPRRRVRRLKGGAGHDRSTEAGSRLRRR